MDVTIAYRLLLLFISISALWLFGWLLWC